MRLLFLASAMSLTPLLLAACAAEPPAQANVAPTQSAGSDLVCTREYPIGSNIPITKCRTREQIEAEKAAGQENLRRTQTGGPNAKMGGG